MKSRLQRQSYLIIGVVLAVAVGYPICAFFPKMRAISRVRQEIRQKQDFVTQTEKLRPQVEQQKAALSSTFAYNKKQRARLVPADDLSRIYSSISKLAKQAGVTTTRFEPHPPVPYDEFRKIPIGLGVSGSSDGVRSLISEIEQLPYTIWLDGVKLESFGENSETTRCQLDLAIFVDNREISN